jgi:arginine repressor
VKPQPGITTPRAIFTLAAVSAMPLIQWGCEDVALLGRPALDARSGRDNVEFIATVEELDHSRRELYLRTQGGQSQIVTYTNRTQVAIDGKEISASELGDGDIIQVRMHGTADGRVVADSIRVRERGDRRSTIEGTVERVVSDRRMIELRTSSGAATIVYLPENSPEIVEDEFSRLRSGDSVRLEGIFFGANRVELTRILKQPE